MTTVNGKKRILSHMAEQNGTESSGAPSATSGGEQLAANSSGSNDQRSIVLTGFGGVRMVKVQPRPIVKPIEGEILINVKAW